MSCVPGPVRSGVPGTRGKIARSAMPLLIACLLLLAGCKKNLYSDLSEVEANQMLAILMGSGISAEKARIGETFTLKVEQNDLVSAIDLLDSKGYPKEKHQSIGTVFQKSGIISSPFEERVRYIYALGEEVAQTLSKIDGVVAARVHVVLPDPPQLGEPVEPSSAAVFIKQDPAVDLEFLVPQIRRLVSSSIEGLDYDAVTVVLTEAIPAEIATKKSEQRVVDVLPGLAVRQSDVGRFWNIAYAVGALVFLLLTASIAAGVAMFVRRRRSRSKSASVSSESTGNALEPS